MEGKHTIPFSAGLSDLQKTVLRTVLEKSKHLVKVNQGERPILTQDLSEAIEAAYELFEGDLFIGLRMQERVGQEAVQDD
jgi:hypothetical protein